MSPRVIACAPGALFQGNDAQLVRNSRLRLHQLLRGPGGGLIKAQSSLDANDQEIQHIGQSQPDLLLPRTDFLAQPEIRCEVSDSQGCRIEEKRILVPIAAS